MIPTIRGIGAFETLMPDDATFVADGVEVAGVFEPLNAAFADGAD